MTFEGGKQIQDPGLTSKIFKLVFNKQLKFELQLKVQSNINVSDLYTRRWCTATRHFLNLKWGIK